MLNPALRIAAVLTALLSPSLAPAQSYELLYEGAGEQKRPVCVGVRDTLEFLRAVHFQMTVLRKTYGYATIALEPRVNGNGDIKCHYLTSTAYFERPGKVIDVVESDGLDTWGEMAMYGVLTNRVILMGGLKKITKQGSNGELYVVVSDMFVRKRP